MQTITSKKFMEIVELENWEELLTGEDTLLVDSGNNRTTMIRIEELLPKHYLQHNMKRQKEKRLYKQLKSEYESTKGDEEKVFQFLHRYSMLRFKRYVPNDDHVLFMIHISKDHPESWKKVIEEDMGYFNKRRGNHFIE